MRGGSWVDDDVPRPSVQQRCGAERTLGERQQPRCGRQAPSLDVCNFWRPHGGARRRRSHSPPAPTIDCGGGEAARGAIHRGRAQPGPLRKRVLRGVGLGRPHCCSGACGALLTALVSCTLRQGASGPLDCATAEQDASAALAIGGAVSGDAAQNGTRNRMRYSQMVSVMLLWMIE